MRFSRLIFVSNLKISYSEGSDDACFSEIIVFPFVKALQAFPSFHAFLVASGYFVALLF